MPEPGRSKAGRAVGGTIRGVRVTTRGSVRLTRWLTRHMLFFRHKGAGGEVGMMRMLDLHAASCAGDTLVTIGLASTVFFGVPVGDARGKVALYLFITMVPFALLAPVVGPLLDRFRHGRRWALAVTMLGRAFLAWLISDYLHNFGLFPAAFGVLALSRAYGVARSAAVPRLLPPTLGLSEAGARASIFGTVAGAIAAPIGLIAGKFGTEWTLRIAAFVFVLGAIAALRLPPRADSDPPETVPRIFKLPGRESVKVLSGRLITSTVTASAALRAVYGFLTLFLAFAIRAHPTQNGHLFGWDLSAGQAIATVAIALGGGSFIATAVGARLRIRRPMALQAVGLLITAITGLLATASYSLGTVVLFVLAASIASGLAKLAVDATIQERIDENVRASAFAHSETLLMLAWVAGGAVGLIPLPGQVGVGLAASFLTAAAVFAWMRAGTLRKERLAGRAAGSPDPLDGTTQRQQPVAPAARPSPAVSSGRTSSASNRWGRRRSASDTTTAATAPAGGRPGAGQTAPDVHPATRVIPRDDPDEPGFHIYRPTESDDAS